MNKERIITVAIILSLLATTVACNKTAEGYFNSGNTKYDQKDFKGAIQDHNKAIELNPSDAEAYLLRGSTKILGDNRGAIQDYNKAIELNPNYADAYFLRGIAKGILGDNREAIQDHNKAIELNPNYAEAYSARGLEKLSLGQKDNGCLDFSKAGEMGDAIAYENIKEYCN